MRLDPRKSPQVWAQESKLREISARAKAFSPKGLTSRRCVAFPHEPDGHGPIPLSSQPQDLTTSPHPITENYILFRQAYLSTYIVSSD